MDIVLLILYIAALLAQLVMPVSAVHRSMFFHRYVVPDAGATQAI